VVRLAIARGLAQQILACIPPCSTVALDGDESSDALHPSPQKHLLKGEGRMEKWPDGGYQLHWGSFRFDSRRQALKHLSGGRRFENIKPLSPVCWLDGPGNLGLAHPALITGTDGALESTGSRRIFRGWTDDVVKPWTSSPATCLLASHHLSKAQEDTHPNRCSSWRLSAAHWLPSPPIRNMGKWPTGHPRIKWQKRQLPDASTR